MAKLRTTDLRQYVEDDDDDDEEQCRSRVIEANPAKRSKILRVGHRGVRWARARALTMKTAVGIASLVDTWASSDFCPNGAELMTLDARTLLRTAAAPSVCRPKDPLPLEQAYF